MNYIKQHTLKNKNFFTVSPVRLFSNRKAIVKTVFDQQPGLEGNGGGDRSGGVEAGQIVEGRREVRKNGQG
jgi:hypothetical protein